MSTTATATATAITEIGQIALTVSDVARAKDFYANKLGLTPLFDAGPSLSFLQCGSVRIMLSTPEGEFKPGGGTILYFRVADIDAAYEQYKERGVEFVNGPHLIARMPDHELWMAFFRDPDGNALQLMCEKR